MSITKLLNKAMTQQMVLWARTGAQDGFGKYTYASPVLKSCRWEEDLQTINVDKEEPIISNAQVFVGEDMAVNDVVALYTGSIPSKPSGVTFVVLMFEKVPTIKGNEFVRKLFLGKRG